MFHMHTHLRVLGTNGPYYLWSANITSERDRQLQYIIKFAVMQCSRRGQLGETEGF